MSCTTCQQRSPPLQRSQSFAPMHSHSQSQAHSPLPQRPQSPRSPRLEGKGYDLPCNTGGMKALRTNGEPCAHSVDCSQKRYDAGLNGHGTRGWVSSPGCRGDERMSQPSSPVVAVAMASPVKHGPPKTRAAELPTRTLLTGTRDKKSVYMVVEKPKNGVMMKRWAYVDNNGL